MEINIVLMDKFKIDKYRPIGSIHTISYRDNNAELTPADKTVSRSRKENMWVHVANMSKVRDVACYSDFCQVFQDTVGDAEYELARVDFAIDSMEPDFFSEYRKLHRYIVLLLANRYSLDNAYESFDLWTLDTLSTAAKSSYIEIENYNKIYEMHGSGKVTSRLELRSKRWPTEKDIPAEFIGKWSERLSESINPVNIIDAENRINIALAVQYKTGCTLRDFVAQWEGFIFSSRQLAKLLDMIGVAGDTKKSARNLKTKLGLEFISRSDLEIVVGRISKAVNDYFTS